VGHGARRHVDDLLGAPEDLEVLAVGDLTDHGCLDVPALGDRHELRELGRLDDRHHPFLGL